MTIWDENLLDTYLRVLRLQRSEFPSKCHTPYQSPRVHLPCQKNNGFLHERASLVQWQDQIGRRYRISSVKCMTTL